MIKPKANKTSTNHVCVSTKISPELYKQLTESIAGVTSISDALRQLIEIYVAKTSKVKQFQDIYSK